MADSGNGRTAEKRTVDKDVGHGAEAADRRSSFVFGRKRVGVVKRPSAVEGTGGIGGASSMYIYSVLAPSHQCVAHYVSAGPLIYNDQGRPSHAPSRSPLGEGLIEQPEQPSHELNLEHNLDLDLVLR